MNLIFDYDGTLHNCLKIYAPSFRKAFAWLTDNGYAEAKSYTGEEIGYWLGFNSADMWSMFQPQLAPEIRDTARRIIGDEMNGHIRNGDAELFEGAEETLIKLRNDGYSLIFLSNCRRRYMETHCAAFGLERYFDYFYCCEDFGFIPKYEIFRKVRPNFSDDFIVIGDRFHDIETATKNGLHSIGCLYGYGSAEELSAADILVNDVREIPLAVEKLCRSACVPERR